MALTLLEKIKVWLFKAVMGVFYGLFLLLSPRRDALSGKKLPPVTNPLLLVSAAQLAKKIRRKEVSSVEVVQAYIDRIQEVNPLLNAVIKDRFDDALQEAAQADKLIEQETGGEDVLEDRLPLLGVPISIKESLSLQGMPHGVGVVSRRNFIQSTDPPVVAYLKRAGAIPMGVTNTPEEEVQVGRALFWQEQERSFGIGSDIAGSIRMPAFFNGIFGHKTSTGIVSSEGEFPPCSGRHEEYESVGPMCRYAEDLLPMLKIMAGPSAQKLSLDTKVDLKKLRFFTIPHDSGSFMVSPVSKELMEIQRKVVQRLEADLGVKVQEVRFPELRHSANIWLSCMDLPDEDGKPPQPFAELFGEPGRPMRPFWELMKWMVGKSDHTMAAIGVSIFQALKPFKASTATFDVEQKESLQRKMEELLGTDGVFLYPSHPRVAPKHHHTLFTPYDCAYTAVFSILGMPITQCPLGLGKEGLPLGVQVGAWRLQDHLTLEVALYLEKAFGGWRDPGAS
ncbi:Fatty-acid amide hydrolase 2-A [Larimichthys crocea]|uniref:Fatty-acid amide hydrolase 2-A n=1 Tax=Larimichthys crocea TaxID=215358 RepID=A0A6G0HJ33_LARCR|nr:Fatty-acid amide hydrolase 2-A [Larimichthys crocea]